MNHHTYYNMTRCICTDYVRVLNEYKEKESKKVTKKSTKKATKKTKKSNRKSISDSEKATESNEGESKIYKTKSVEKSKSFDSEKTITMEEELIEKYDKVKQETIRNAFIECITK